MLAIFDLLIFKSFAKYENNLNNFCSMLSKHYPVNSKLALLLGDGMSCSILAFSSSVDQTINCVLRHFLLSLTGNLLNSDWLL